MNMSGMTKGRYNREAYLEKVRSHFADLVDECKMGAVSGPCEIKFILRRVAYYGVYMEEYYDDVMQNW